MTKRKEPKFPRLRYCLIIFLFRISDLDIRICFFFLSYSAKLCYYPKSSRNISLNLAMSILNFEFGRYDLNLQF